MGDACEQTKGMPSVQDQAGCQEGQEILNQDSGSSTSILIRAVALRLPSMLFLHRSGRSRSDPCPGFSSRRGLSLVSSHLWLILKIYKDDVNLWTLIIGDNILW